MAAIGGGRPPEITAQDYDQWLQGKGSLETGEVFDLREEIELIQQKDSPVIELEKAVTELNSQCWKNTPKEELEKNYIELTKRFIEIVDATDKVSGYILTMREQLIYYNNNSGTDKQTIQKKIQSLETATNEMNKSLLGSLGLISYFKLLDNAIRYKIKEPEFRILTTHIYPVED